MILQISRTNKTIAYVFIFLLLFLQHDLEATSAATGIQEGIPQPQDVQHGDGKSKHYASKSKKRVTFAEGPKLHQVHNLITWSFAYQQSRISLWNQAAADKVRFQRRINTVEKLIDNVLKKKQVQGPMPTDV